jgi:hypothetical protein
LSRTTKRDVQNAFDSLRLAATAAGIDSSTWIMEEGSATYGRAFRLYRRDPEHYGVANVTGLDSFLGTSRREAYLSLRAAANALWLVAHERETVPA